MQTRYQGSCHCGAIRFDVMADIDHMRICDCSICRMRAALNFRVPESALRLLTPLEVLTVYRWRSMTGADYFCPTCGIQPFRRPAQPTEVERAAGVQPFDGWTINLRCLEGLDLSGLPVVHVEGRLI